MTHDLAETLSFPRVVVEQGRLVEDGTPKQLAADRSSRYRALLDAETALTEELWSAPTWQRWRLEEGRLQTSATASNARPDATPAVARISANSSRARG